MAAPVFLDTNVLVYAYDHADPAKQQAAHKLINRILDAGTGRISTQVVQEFCNVVIRKVQTIDASSLKGIISATLQPLLAHQPSVDFYQRALDLHKTKQLSFYDALIVQAAMDLGCETLYSEDLQAGQKFGGITIVNPFV